MARFGVVVTYPPQTLAATSAQHQAKHLHLRILLPFLVLSVLMLPLAQAQIGPAPTVADQLGIIPYMSYHGGDIDSVNLANGRVMIHAPLISYPQRGGLLKESFSLGNGSNALQVQQLCTPPPDVICLYEWNAGTSKQQIFGTVSAQVTVIDDQLPRGARCR